MPMMAPMFGSTLMTKTFSSLPTNSAQPLLAGKMPRIWTGTTSFFILTVYCANPKKQVLRATEHYGYPPHLHLDRNLSRSLYRTSPFGAPSPDRPTGLPCPTGSAQVLTFRASDFMDLPPHAA